MDLSATRDPAALLRERDFSRDASHELRTPLTVIRVASDLIAHDEALSTQSRRSLGRIQDAVAGMEAIIDALLLLSRSERVPLQIEDVDVRLVVERELGRIRPLLEQRRLSLDLDVEAEPVVRAPPQALPVMLGNLLGNAARFTDIGGVRVRLLADRLEVLDTGIGMDAATLARACEPFYHGDGEGKPAIGPGLGLSIARRLGQRCGWPLRLSSVPGQGTCASIEFAAPPEGG